MKISAFTVDPAAIEGGEWVDDLPECGDLRIKTKGIGNAAFKRMQAAKLRALPRAARNNGQIDPLIMEQINLECVVETCLQDWGNLEDESGPVPYSIEAARAYCADPRYAPLQSAFVIAAGRVGDARAEDVGDAAGNSPRGSRGK